MKKSWTPQYNSFIFNQIWFWGILALIACCILYFFSENIYTYILYVSIIWIITIIFMIHLHIQRIIWKVFGYKKITIDTTEKYILLDNYYKISFNDISHIEFINRVINKTTPIIFKHTSKDFGIDILFANKKMIFELKNNARVEFTIHNRFSGYNILNFIKNECQLPVEFKRTQSD